MSELAAAVALTATLPVLLGMAGGVVIGALVGVLPGLNGITALALLVPLTAGLPVPVALALLVSAYAAVSQGGSVTAIALGVPGEVPNAATVLDGLPLAQAGRAGEAMGAALMASAIGGLVGASLLVAGLLGVRGMALAFGSADLLAIALGGLGAVALLDRHPARALAAAAVGIALASVGYSPVSGEPRLWFGWDVLLDGLPLVAVITGLFAVPELVHMIAPARSAITRVPTDGLTQGIYATLRHPGLLARSAAVGVVVGLAPGAGAGVATFLAYAAAKRLDRDPDSFGRGRIEGVIAPEAASNAKEGGALLPTLALGIPGSAAMTILLGAFVLHGLPVGPGFLEQHLPLALALAGMLAVGNLVSAFALMPLATLLTRLVVGHRRHLGILLLVATLAGIYAARQQPADLLFAGAFALLGDAMKRTALPRAALVLGFVLGPLIERYGHITSQAYGMAALLRPSVWVIVSVIAFLVVAPRLRRARH